MIKGLYIHIPFCKHVCFYCNFPKALYNEALADRYLNRLEKELSTIEQDHFDGIYIGGGTPTALSEKQLDRLLSFIDKYSFQEFTVEINPETFNREKAKLFKKHRVNRASIGIQSFNENLLIVMGRKHTNADVYNTISLLRENGIDNISVDLIYGFLNQTVAMIKEDIDKAVGLGVKHVSIYELELHEDTLFHKQGYYGADDESNYEFYDFAIRYLNSLGYKQYETSNFALEGFQSIHNKVYWHFEDYYGAGLGASGKIGRRYWRNTTNFVKYLSEEDVQEITELSEEEERFEAIMMGLRLLEGIDLKDFAERFGVDIEKHYQKAVEKNIQEGLLCIEKGFLKPTGKGVFVLNDILLDFMDYL